VDIVNDGICDMMEAFVWEPSLVKRNSIMAATEAACLILSVDETVRNPRSGNGDDRSAIANGGAGAMMNSNLVRSAMGKKGPGPGKGPKVLKGRGGA